MKLKDELLDESSFAYIEPEYARRYEVTHEVKSHDICMCLKSAAFRLDLPPIPLYQDMLFGASLSITTCYC